MSTARNQPSLPTHRAFVVQLRSESKIEKGQFKGRAENIVSGQSTHFSTTKALKAWAAAFAKRLGELGACRRK